MAALVQDERIYETSVTTGTGEYTLAGAVTGFQPASVIGNGNYLFGFVTDDTNWEAGIYTYASGPDRLQRTHIVASSNGDAAVNWGSGTKKLRCGPLAAFGVPRQQSKSVAGSADVTLTALEQRCDQLILTGALTGNINVIVDTTKWAWSIYNNTSGAYTVTVKTSAGTGVAITQGKRAVLQCDGTDVVPLMNDLTALGALASSGGTMTGDITMSGASIVEAEGAAVASASSCNIWATDGNTVHVTGTTTINDFGTAPQAGAWMKVVFDGALTLTQSANLNLNGGGSNIAVAAGDIAFVYADTTTQMDVVVLPKNGQPIRSGARSWTPADGSGAGLSLTVNTARYVEIGDLVHVDLDITYPATASGANANISGFPLATGSGNASGAVCFYSDFTAVDVVELLMAGTTANVYQGTTHLTNANLSGKTLRASFSYIK